MVLDVIGAVDCGLKANPVQQSKSVPMCSGPATAFPIFTELMLAQLRAAYVLLAGTLPDLPAKFTLDADYQGLAKRVPALLHAKKVKFICTVLTVEEARA
jgi:hypothetical protein